MKKNLLKIALAATLVCSALAFTACGEDTHTHNWSDWETKVIATCTKNGSEIRKCACGETEVRKVEAGHIWGDWMIVQQESCQNAGSRTRTCKRDGAHMETETIPLDPDAHAWRASVYKTKPTCTQGGEQYFICENDLSHSSWRTVDPAHNWGEWTKTENPTCSTEGTKTHTCTDCNAVESEPIAPLGHVYTDGKCTCGDGPIYPTADKDILYRNPLDQNSGIQGAGEAYNRFQLHEGYYEIEIPATGEVWLSFSSSQPGQYALYSIENPNNITATRYDASEQFIPEKNFPAVTFDGNLYSNVNANPQYWSYSWRATYCLKGKRGDKIKLRFVRIADSPKTAKKIIEYPAPEQLVLEKAPEGGNGTIIREVDYDNQYYYNEADGYYYTEDGNLLYVAITKIPERLFPDCSFATMVAYGGSYTLHHSTTVDGDYLVKDYSWFLTNHGGQGYMDEDRNFVLNEGNPNLPCYQNYVNSDGMYPVNQELFDFLNLYVKNYPISGVNSNVGWLSACYEYIYATPGSVDFPYDVTESFTITTKKSGQTYYRLIPNDGVSKYTISVVGETNGYLYINDKKYENAFTLTVDVGTKGLTFYASSLLYMQSVTFDVIITPVTEEESATPLQLGENSVSVAITNGYAESKLCRFTAEKTGKYRILPADGEEYADIYLHESMGETYLQELPYEFNLNEGDDIFFSISSVNYMATDEDVIDFVLEYYDESTQNWVRE